GRALWRCRRRIRVDRRERNVSGHRRPAHASPLPEGRSLAMVGGDWLAVRTGFADRVYRPRARDSFDVTACRNLYTAGAVPLYDGCGSPGFPLVEVMVVNA